MTDDPTRQTEPIDPTDATQPIPVPPAAAQAAASPAAAAPAPGGIPGFEASPARVSPSGPSRVRWAVGLGVAGLAAAVTLGAIILLGASPSPEALRYIPGDAAIVAELRLDLPGDQLQKLGNLLAHFPGFRDQTTLGDKLDEAFTQLVGGATDSKLDYRTDLKPWLNGPAFVGVQVPAGGGNGSPLLSATPNGAVDCATALGGTVTRESHRGLELVIAGDGDMKGLACVVDGRQALLGEPATVRAGLDAKANGTGIDRNAAYGNARAALGGDRIATVFVSGAALTNLGPLPSLGAGDVPGLGGLGGLGVLGSRVPDWTMVGIRAEDDAIVVDTVAAPVPAPTGGASQVPLPATHPSVIAGMLPADTILFAETQGAGATLQNVLATLRSDPALGQALGTLEGLGGAGELVGWVEDAGLAVVGDAKAPSAGVILVAADDATAAQQLTTVRGLLGFMGAGGGIELRESTVAGVEVLTVVITDIGSLIPPGTLPDGMNATPTGPIEFSLAAKGRALLVGVGDAFMTGVLNVQSGASLADQEAFKQAAERGLASSRWSVYVGVATGRGLIEAMLPAEALTQWQTEILPYVAPIQAVGVTSTDDGSALRSRFVITVVAEAN